MKKRIRVLVVDDSSLARSILSQGLAMDPGIEVVGTASTPNEADSLVASLAPDVLTLDYEMPGMNGLGYLRRLMAHNPLPVVMVSAHTERGARVTLDALAAGAIDFVTKPDSAYSSDLNTMMMELRAKVKLASSARIKRGEKPQNPRVAARSAGRSPMADDMVIAIGASTGGTEAIREVITRFPSDTPGVVIVQHMPPGFTAIFANRLDELCAMKVKEAATGDPVERGTILVAPGARQMKVITVNGRMSVKCFEGEKVNGHCPSVEVMMNSVAGEAGQDAIGIMLTGMGRDGALGLKAMRDAGARTMAQDEETSVVFGMPGAAWQIGAAERLVPIGEIADVALDFISGRQKCRE